MPAQTDKKNSHIYFFVGTDSFSREEKVRYWKNKFEEKYGKGGISVIDCDSSRSDEELCQAFKNSLSGSTLFSTQTLVIIKNIFVRKLPLTHQYFIDHSGSLPDTHFLVFSDEKHDGRLSLGKKILEMIKNRSAIREEFQQPVGTQLKKWIIDRAQSHGGSFDTTALPFFLNHFTQTQTADPADENDNPHANLWIIDNEIRKLTAHAKDRPITVDDVHACTSLPTLSHVFDLMDALLARNPHNALCCAHYVLGNDQNINTPSLLGMLAFLTTQIRSFLLLKNMIEDKKNESEIANLLGWNNKRVWVVGKKLDQFSSNQLRLMYGLVLDFEKKLKTGAGNPILELDLLLRRLVTC